METFENGVAVFMTNIPSFKGLLWVSFGVFLVVYILLSAVLLYHWRRYSLQNKRVVFAETAYVSVSIIMIAAAVFALFAI